MLKLRRDLETKLGELIQTATTFGSQLRVNKQEAARYEALVVKLQCDLVDEFYRLTAEGSVTEEWWSKWHEACQPNDADIRIIRVAENGSFELTKNETHINIGCPSIEQIIRLSFALSKLENVRPCYR